MADVIDASVAIKWFMPKKAKTAPYIGSKTY